MSLTPARRPVSRLVIAIAGPAAHEGPGKGGGRQRSEDGQIGLGMPDVQWHGRRPLSAGEPPTGRDKTCRAFQAAPRFWLHWVLTPCGVILWKLQGRPTHVAQYHSADFDMGCPIHLAGDSPRLLPRDCPTTLASRRWGNALILNKESRCSLEWGNFTSYKICSHKHAAPAQDNSRFAHKT